jgi:hypothetical protein
MTAGGEPRCRNCGVAAPGAYCTACGQDTRPGLPTFTQFMREATGRYVALDGRLWRTLVPLFLRPGFLTREYLAGRRRRYIGPARLFLVASLLLFAVLRLQSDGIETHLQVNESATDTETGTEATADPSRVIDEALTVDLGDFDVAKGELKRRVERFNRLPIEQKIEQMVAGVLRYGPYAMFVLLPAFAALLEVLYLGRRRTGRPHLYGEHLVFAAHTHAFLSLAGVAFVLVPSELVKLAIGSWAAIYLIRALRAVYGGSWTGIVARSSVLFVGYSVLQGIAVAALLAAAILVR